MLRFYIMTIVVILLSPLSLYGEEKVRLSYGGDVPALIVYSHYLENNSIMSVISREHGAQEEVLKKESFQEMEIKKDIELTSQSAVQLEKGSLEFLVSQEVANVVWEDNDRNETRSIRPRISEIKFDSTGRLQKKIELSELSYLSFPVIFPQEPITVGQSWSNTQEIKIADLFSIVLSINYKLEKILNLSGKEVAEILYSIQAELKSTEVTDDPVLLQKIDRLRASGIEKITISGKGKMGFDIAGHIPMSNTVSLVVETTKRFVVGRQRELRELIREIHKAEVWLSL